MMLMLIMILFFVCWTPLLLFNMLAAFEVIDPTLTQGTKTSSLFKVSMLKTTYKGSVKQKPTGVQN
jgi:hypothetical protein